MKHLLFSRVWRRGLVLLSAAFYAGTSAWAQWATQTVQLSPGWNVVFLEVQPEPRECDLVLDGLPVESVWLFNRRFAPAQFLLSTNQPIANPEDWLVWVNPQHALTNQQSLFILEGGRSYLVRTTNATTVEWPVHGTPVIREAGWLADSLSLVGFSLPLTTPPSFASFFAGSRNLAPGPVIHRLSTDGTWLQVAPTSAMRRGEAFWVRSQGLPDSSGPLKVMVARRTGLDFGRILTEETIRIRNDSSAPVTMTVRQISSDPPPPTGTFPVIAAGVPLSYWQNDFAGGQVGWSPLTEEGSPLVQSNVPPGGVWELRLAVRRQAMARPPAAPDPPGVLYQSLLEISDTGGLCRHLVPVSAEGLSISGTAKQGFGSLARGKDGAALHPRAGLWIGSASIQKVSQPSSGSPDEPVPVASEFQFRLLVHVDAQGQSRLLQKVLQMWRPGSYKEAEDGSTNRVVDQPGRFVLVTDETRIAGLTGAAIRDGQSVGRRFSSAAFGFREPILLTGTNEFGADQVTVTGTILVAYDDPLSPFVHRYHPDHNNLNDRREPLTLRSDARGRSTAESFDVTRRIDLTFTLGDPDGLTLAGWGDTQLGGVYRERISGLHKNDLFLQGTFRLHRASEIAVLNDGN
jgi:hypothetical protein